MSKRTSLQKILPLLIDAPSVRKSIDHQLKLVFLPYVPDLGSKPKELSIASDTKKKGECTIIVFRIGDGEHTISVSVMIA